MENRSGSSTMGNRLGAGGLDGKTGMSPQSLGADAEQRDGGLTQGWSKNVSQTERIVTGLGGAVLALSGIRRGGLSGIAALVAGGALVARAATGHCPLYQRLGADDREQRMAGQRGWTSAAVTRESVFINRPREQLYGFWREFGNLAKVMSHVERVDVLDARHSRWLVSLPLGKELQWKSTVTEDRPNERIAWKADADSDLANSGWVEFRDAGARGTEVIVQIAYEPPGGQFGAAIARLWPNSPGALLKDDLEEFKRKVEAGEIGLQAFARGASAGGSAAGLTPPTQRH